MEKKLLILFFVGFSFISLAQNLKVKGDWYTSFSQSDIFDTGLDYSSSKLSNKKQIKLKVQKQSQPKSFGWKIDVHKLDILWDYRLKLYAKITGQGKGSGNINSGFFFVQIGSSPVTLVSGSGQLNNIPVQLELKGISVLVPAEAYSTLLVFTLIED